MIVLTIAGESSRFFSEGYPVVKYKLKIFNEKPIIWHILSYMNRDDKIIIVANKKFDDANWLSNLLSDLGFKNYDIVEIGLTDGQLTSAVLGILNSKFYLEKYLNEPILIYNGDTIRHMPFSVDMSNIDGCLEVFHESGNHWSFVDNLGDVSMVKEKERISNFCSTGLYGFSSINLFLKYSNQSKLVKDERYIAPVYNELIKDGLKVKSILSQRKCFTLCGTPEEYKEAIRSSYKE